MGTAYNKKQLDKLLELHTEDHAITSDDKQLLSSALNFSEKNTGMIMTKLGDAVYQSGYTRVPVYENKRTIIVGVLFAKDLILLDPNDEIPHLDEMLKEMQSSRSHLYFIVAPPISRSSASFAERSNTFSKKLPRLTPSDLQVENVVGIVTMEDLIEELISREIIDDFDEVCDNVSRKRVADSRRADRLEFFDMLQRREVLQPDKRKKGPAWSVKTNEEVRALVSFLSSNVPMFKPAAMSSIILRRLVLRSKLIHVTSDDIKQGRFVYALVEENYAPDYTAQFISPACIFFVSREDLQAALTMSRELDTRVARDMPHATCEQLSQPAKPQRERSNSTLTTRTQLMPSDSPQQERTMQSSIEERRSSWTPSGRRSGGSL
ncbi:MAG: hypothetical protein SGPRY_004140 [Prymnesium sp.]